MLISFYCLGISCWPARHLMIHDPSGRVVSRVLNKSRIWHQRPGTHSREQYIQSFVCHFVKLEGANVAVDMCVCCRALDKMSIICIHSFGKNYCRTIPSSANDSMPGKYRIISHTHTHIEARRMAATK